MEPEIQLLLAVAEQMPMHEHIAELMKIVRERALQREKVGEESQRGRVGEAKLPDGSSMALVPVGDVVLEPAEPKPGED